MSFKSSPRLHERVNMFEWLCYWPVRCLTHASLSVWFRGRMLGHSFSHTFPSTSSHLCNGGFRTCFYTCTKLHRLVCDLVHMWSVELALLTFSSEHQIKQQLTTAGQGASSKTARIDGFVLEWFTRICQTQIKSLRGENLSFDAWMCIISYLNHVLRVFLGCYDFITAQQLLQLSSF